MSIPNTVSGLQVWLDAQDISTLNLSGNSVISWNDKSTNTRTATINGSSATYISNDFNGNPVVSFNGGTQGMTIPIITPLTVVI
jgi:hypothetical protein